MLKQHPTLEKVQCSEDGRVFVDGIEKTSFRFRVDNKQHLRHVLVADTFMDRQPDKRLHFIDGDKTNCAVSNLAYGASEEKKERARAKAEGVKKYTDEQILKVVDKLNELKDYREVASATGIPYAIVSQINRGKYKPELTGIDPNKPRPKNWNTFAMPNGQYACVIENPPTVFNTLEEAQKRVKKIYRDFYSLGK